MLEMNINDHNNPNKYLIVGISIIFNIITTVNRSINIINTIKYTLNTLVSFELYASIFVRKYFEKITIFMAHMSFTGY